MLDSQKMQAVKVGLMFSKKNFPEIIPSLYLTTKKEISIKIFNNKLKRTTFSN